MNWTGAQLPTEQKALEIISLSRCWTWCCYIHFPLHLQHIWSGVELPFLGRGLHKWRAISSASSSTGASVGAPPFLAKTMFLFDRQPVSLTSTSAELWCLKQGDDCTWKQITKGYFKSSRVEQWLNKHCPGHRVKGRGEHFCKYSSLFQGPEPLPLGIPPWVISGKGCW